MLWKLLSSQKDTVLVLKRELIKYSSMKWDKNLYSWWKWKQKSLSCVWLFVTPWTVWNSPGQDTGVGSLSLLQRIFPTQGLNPGLLHCRQILYQLRHKGSPRILESVAYSFSSGSSWPRNQTGVYSMQADSLPTELSGKPKVPIAGKKLTCLISWKNYWHWSSQCHLTEDTRNT